MFRQTVERTIQVAKIGLAAEKAKMESAVARVGLAQQLSPFQAFFREGGELADTDGDQFKAPGRWVNVAALMGHCHACRALSQSNIANLVPARKRSISTIRNGCCGVALVACCVATFVQGRPSLVELNARGSVLIFTVVNVVAVAQTWVISMGLAYYLLPRAGVTRFAPEIAHAAGVIFPAFTSYLGHKRWSFR